MADYQSIPISVPPGIYSDTTELDAQGRWVDGSNVRFFKGRPRRIGSWAELVDSENTESPIRGMHVWNTNAGAPWVAFGSADGLYLYDGTEYDITPSGWTTGLTDAENPTGYGSGLYGTGWYGGGNILGVSLTPPTIWSMDTYGEDLVTVPIGEGSLYLWDSSVGTGTAAAVVSGAPTGNLGVLVTDDRHVLLFGAGGDRLRIEWCDQENITEWTPLATNTAGGFTLEVGTQIMGWCKTGQGVIVVTDRAAYLLQYIGGELTFSKQLIGMECGCIGPQAIVGVDSAAYWMGTNAFFTFNGRVNRLPCDVRDAVYTDLNSYQAQKIVAGTNSRYGEITWFYPAESSGNAENNRYVTFAPGQGWSKGTLARTAWVDASGVIFSYPLAADATGSIYTHEVPGADEQIAWTLELGTQDAAGGSAHVHVRKIIPDWEQCDGDVDVSVLVKNAPNDTARTKGPYTMTPTTTEVPVRARGQFAGLEWSGSDEFIMGRPSVLVRTGGARL